MPVVNFYYNSAYRSLNIPNSSPFNTYFKQCYGSPADFSVVANGATETPYRYYNGGSYTQMYANENPPIEVAGVILQQYSWSSSFSSCRLIIKGLRFDRGIYTGESITINVARYSIDEGDYSYDGTYTKTVNGTSDGCDDGTIFLDSSPSPSYNILPVGTMYCYWISINKGGRYYYLALGDDGDSDSGFYISQPSSSTYYNIKLTKVTASPSYYNSSAPLYTVGRGANRYDIACYSPRNNRGVPLEGTSYINNNSLPHNG